jgi:hypothetical protein
MPDASPDLPTLTEILQLTLGELTSPLANVSSPTDDIVECGRACVALLAHDPATCLRIAYQHLHNVPYKEVKRCWRRLYTDAALRCAVAVAEGRNDDVDGENSGAGDWVTQVVRILDMALILTGAPGREELFELWFAALEGVLGREAAQDGERRPAKRRKLASSPVCIQKTTQNTTHVEPPSTVPSTISTPPRLLHPLQRVAAPSLEAFQLKVGKVEMQNPFIIEGAIEHWPALHERPWKDPEYLLRKTLGGRRLVPVEIGRSYTDENWGQKIIAFGEFMSKHMLPRNPDVPPDAPTQTGYLAQHDLLTQIPSLRADISIPDYCYSSPPSPPPPHPLTSSVTKPLTPILEEPLLNAWFGPANTVSPLHTDPYHNILSQVCGYKYVRLYSPTEGENVYPRGIEEGGVDMSNTSAVDLDVAMQTWPEISCWGDEPNGCGGGREGDDAACDERASYADRYARFKDARYVEGVLGPGECLYVPPGWWHYVRSLTPSFSVSFWFN